MRGKFGCSPAPVVPVRLEGFSGRSSGKGARIARGTFTGCQVLIRITQVPNHDQHGRVILNDMVNSGGGVVCKP